jgi:uncharacterized membrane-anchored protein YhcB (DUF1043 family)
MKFSKTTLIILGVIVFAVIAGLLYMRYSRQLGEQDQIKSKIDANKAQLTRLVAEREKYQSELAKVEEELAQKKRDLDAALLSLNAAKTNWPDEAQSIEYETKLFDLADGWNLQITVVQTGEPGTQNIQGITFSTYTYNVSVTGLPLTEGFEKATEYQDYIYEEVANILGFITSVVHDDYFSTANIDVVNISIPPLLTSEEVVAQGVNLAKPVSNINVTVFTYKGG